MCVSIERLKLCVDTDWKSITLSLHCKKFILHYQATSYVLLSLGSYNHLINHFAAVLEVPISLNMGQDVLSFLSNVQVPSKVINSDGIMRIEV